MNAVGESRMLDGMRSQAHVAAMRHSRRVQQLKRAIPIAGVLLIVAFVAFTIARRPSLPVEIDVSGAAISNGQLVMADPKLDGTTPDGRPYRMVATRATQDLKNTGLVRLEDINADLPVNGDVRARVLSASGRYDNAASTMEFDSPVTATTTDGTVARLQDAFIDIAAGGLSTSRPVEIKSEGATVTAGTMSVSQGGKVIVFERNVRLTINPDRLKQAGEPGAANGATN